METPQTTAGRPTPDTRISIEKYLQQLEARRLQTISSRKIGPIPLTYDQFSRLVMAHGSNYLAERGETVRFTIDHGNEPVIRQLYLYFTGDPSFSGHLTRGILINGRYGSGKTAVMHAVMRTFNDCVRHWKEQGTAIPPMRLFKSSDIVEAFRYEAGKNGEKSEPGQGEQIKISVTRKNYLTGIVAIDELGREQKEINLWGTVIQPLSQILQERYDSGWPTFATANFRLDTLAQEDFYGKMIGDRLRQMFNTIELKGESRRK